MPSPLPRYSLFLAILALPGCQPSRPSPVTLPESGAVQFIWGSWYDTDIELNAFFGTDHSLMVRFMPQYELSFEAPIVSNGSTPGVPVYSVGTEATCLVTTAPCPHDQLGAGLFLRLGTDKFTYSIPHPVPYMDGLEKDGHAPVPSPAVWRHLFLIRRGTVLELWLDGDHLCRLFEPATACDTPINSIAPAGLLKLGERATGSNEKTGQFYGFIDDLAIFDHALTPDELNGWFLTGSGISENATGLSTGINFDHASQTGGPRIRPASALGGSATIVSVSAQHASGIDAPQLPILEGTAPIELPFMGGQVWEVIQQFAVRGSHASDAAFCWDFVHVPDDQPRGHPRGFGVQSDSIKFIAGADGTVLRADDTHPTATTDGTPNSIDVQRGPDEILQYLHLKTGSAEVAVNDAVTRGERLGIVSNVGGGTPHLHFAVLTRIDNAYVSRPAYFTSYCVSKDFGQSWEFVAVGMPTNGQWVKRANVELPAC